jgi:hypothetical protein
MPASATPRLASVQHKATHAADALFQPTPAKALDRKNGCPACGTRRPIAPVSSRHRSPLGAEHDWRCAACDHAWTTSATVGTQAGTPGRGPRFAVGASVRLLIRYGSRAMPAEAFVVVALRPSDSGDTQYRIKCPTENFERVARESELAPATRHDGT